MYLMKITDNIFSSRHLTTSFCVTYYTRVEILENAIKECTDLTLKRKYQYLENCPRPHPRFSSTFVTCRLFCHV